MSGDLTLGDVAARMAREYEVQQLVARVATCSRRVEGVLAGFRDIQLLDWRSPAGRAYRNSVALQEVALGRARVRLEDALVAVNRHAQEVGPSSGSTVGRY
jgi:hypothetical protein